MCFHDGEFGSPSHSLSSRARPRSGFSKNPSHPQSRRRDGPWGTVIPLSRFRTRSRAGAGARRRSSAHFALRVMRRQRAPPFWPYFSGLFCTLVCEDDLLAALDRRQNNGALSAQMRRAKPFFASDKTCPKDFSCIFLRSLLSRI